MVDNAVAVPGYCRPAASGYGFVPIALPADQIALAVAVDVAVALAEL